MSTAAVAPETTRYEGLIRTAQELFDTHEESGWRLANVIYDLVKIRREEGYLLEHRDKGMVTAYIKVAQDLDRYKMGKATVHAYYKAWERYGQPDKRLPDLTFTDHQVLARRYAGEGAVAAVRERRLQIIEGKKPTFGSPNTAAAAGAKSVSSGSAEGDRHGRHLNAMTKLALAKSSLRRLRKTDVWDFRDHQKVLAELSAIRDLLDQVDAKPWNPEQVSP